MCFTQVKDDIPRAIKIALRVKVHTTKPADLSSGTHTEGGEKRILKGAL